MSNRELAEAVMAAAIKSTALLVLSLLLNAGRGVAAEDALVDTRGWPIHHELLPHSQDQNKAVELFWAKPEGNGPFPVVLFIHGHQEGPRDGGEAYVRTGRLGIMARRGAAAGALGDPVPQALVITGIVVAFAATALAVALLLRLSEEASRGGLDRPRDDRADG